jgi:hypothetical protein
VVLLAGFYFLGGFEMPERMMPAEFRKSWMMCMVLFVFGAVQVSVVDHWAGNVDRSNLRSIHVILGVIFMAVGLAWKSMLRGHLESVLLAGGSVVVGLPIDVVEEVVGSGWR